MSRKPRVQRTPEEKWQIVLEGLKSGNVAETCRKYEIAPNLHTRDGELEFAVPAPTGSAPGHLVAFSHQNDLGNCCNRRLHQLNSFKRKQEAAQESYSSCRSVGSDCKGCYFSKTFDGRLGILDHRMQVELRVSSRSSFSLPPFGRFLC